MGEDVAQKDDVHELPCIGQGGIARTKGAQDGVEKEIDTHLKEESAEDVEQHHVAQDFARRLIVLLTEAHTHQRGAAHTHHRTKGGRDGHEWIGERKAGDGVGTHTLPDEDAIDNVVERRGHHGDDGRQSILEQESAHGLFTQYGVLFGRGHGRRNQQSSCSCMKRSMSSMPRSVAQPRKVTITKQRKQWLKVWSAKRSSLRTLRTWVCMVSNMKR